MSTFLDVALSCIERGWYVFPCWPETKKPMTAHGWHDATVNEAQVRAWWTKTPNANVAIGCNPSNLCVVDIDHGLPREHTSQWPVLLPSVPDTYIVRTGRRPEFGVQIYFAGTISDVGEWELNGCSGQVKSAGGYVMAAGSIHPESKQTYQVLADYSPAPIPYWVRQLKTRQKERAADDGGPITSNRNVTLTSVAGKLRNAGLTRDALETALLQVNADRCAPPLEEEEVKQIAAHASKWEIPEPEPIAIIGGRTEMSVPAEPVDWRTHYHTFDEMDNAPPASFLIDGFLQVDAITALAAPVGQRKSLIALNVAHALCTKEALFDHFPVRRQPERVLYLCPEMGLRSFTDRLRKIGLMPYVGRTLFCRTMSAEGTLELDDMTPEELHGSVVIIDTAVRYLKGDENSSEHMRKFAESIFRIMREGAISVLLLHHSAKGTKETNELTLENTMRGSGELGAFVSSCWGTRLQNPAEPYQSASFIANVKQRDFQSQPFEVTSGPDCRLHIVGSPGTVTLQARKGFKGNRDGKDEAAIALIKASPKLSAVKLSQLLKEHDIGRSSEWVRKRRFELVQDNGGMMP